MKKLGAMLLVLALIFTVSACGNKAENKKDNKDTSSANNSSVTDVNSSQDSSSAQPLVLDKPDSYTDEEEENAEPTAEELVESYVSYNKAEILAAKEEAFMTGGLTCESDVEVKGRGFVITFKICQMEHISAAQKEVQQESYNGMQDIADQMLLDYQAEIPVIEYFRINFCDKNGELIAYIKAGKN